MAFMLYFEVVWSATYSCYLNRSLFLP